MNEEETGDLEVMPEQPHLGSPLTAELTDEDGVETITSWQWARANSPTFAGPFDAANSVISGATTETYTPVAADGGMYLQAMVMYTDGSRLPVPMGTPMPVRTLMAVSENAVLAAPATQNAPTFSQGTYRRTVAENAPVSMSTATPPLPGAIVGDPIVAMDEDNEDMVSYIVPGWWRCHVLRPAHSRPRWRRSNR